jgi:alpha-L-fucosidase
MQLCKGLINISSETIIIALVLVLTFCSFGTPVKSVSESVYKNDPARSEEFMDWGLGMFVHWSMDSQLGCVISHSMVGASREYLNAYINELPKTFNPVNYDPDKWVQTAKLAGAKYIVFTTKHHSGFCMWDTKTTDFSIMNTPYKKDITRKFVKACRKNDLKVGFYFSPEDFYFLNKQGYVIRRKAGYVNISNNPALLDYNKRQVKELMSRYGNIDIVFLDAFDNEFIRQYIHQLQPACLVTRGEMATPEQSIPDSPMPGPWEANFTLGNQWQYKPTNEEYKSGTKLIEMLIDIRAKGGNLLINVGPDPEGVIPFEQERRFRELALWMFVNSEAIYNIRPCDVIRYGDLYFTRSKDGSSVYVFLTGQNPWPRGERREFTIKSLKATDQTRISVLGQNDIVVEYQPPNDPSSRFEQKAGSLNISVVRAQRLYNDSNWPNPVVVRLDNVEFVRY